jgi:SET domain-containing protein
MLAIERFPGKGRGVVAMRGFRAGEVIERCPVIVVPRDEVPLIVQTRLKSYYYEWGDDDSQAAIPLGYGALYNHSYAPNARYEFHEREEMLHFVALRDIREGEEIAINYHNLGPDANKPVNFVVRD